MEYPHIKISADSTSKEIAPIAMAVHEMVSGLPVTMRTLNNKGVRIETGNVIDWEYSLGEWEYIISPYRGGDILIIAGMDRDATSEAVQDLISSFEVAGE